MNTAPTSSPVTSSTHAPSTPTPPPSAQSQPLDAAPFAGAAGGLIAGIAYLAAQTLFSWALHGDVWAPMQRIAAILLGEDAAPPLGDFSITVAGMALLIHLPLAAAYGRLLCNMIHRDAALPAAALRGAIFGLLLFAINFWLIAPLVFPWFEESRTLATAFDHALFGAIAGACYVTLWRSWRTDGLAQPAAN